MATSTATEVACAPLMLVTSAIEALRPYQAGKPVEQLAREMGVSEAVKLASNENPLGPGSAVRAFFSTGDISLGRYPDAATYELRESLARHLAVSADELVMGAGSNEVIELLIRTFATHEHHAVFATPSFVVYQSATMAHGLDCTAVPLKDDTHDLPAMCDAVRPNTRLMFIANPNNPTGTHASVEALSTLLRTVPEEVIVVVDEAYFEYADAADYPDSLTLRTLRERLVVLRTFSKIHGLAALRVGYGVAPRLLVDYVNRVRAPFNVNAIAQGAAMAALQDEEHVRQSFEMNLLEKARLASRLSGMGWSVTPSQANFLYVDVKQDAAALYSKLLKRGVIVRSFAPLPSKLRITVGTREENDCLIEAARREL